MTGWAGSRSLASRSDVLSGWVLVGLPTIVFPCLRSYVAILTACCVGEPRIRVARVSAPSASRAAPPAVPGSLPFRAQTPAGRPDGSFCQASNTARFSGTSRSRDWFVSASFSSPRRNFTTPAVVASVRPSSIADLMAARNCGASWASFPVSRKSTCSAADERYCGSDRKWSCVVRLNRHCSPPSGTPRGENSSGLGESSGWPINADVAGQASDDPRRQHTIEFCRVQHGQCPGLAQSQQLFRERWLAGRHIEQYLSLQADYVDRGQRGVSLTWRLAVDHHLQRIEAEVGRPVYAGKAIRKIGHLPANFRHFGGGPLGIRFAGVGGDRKLVLANFPAAMRRCLPSHGPVELIGNSWADVLHAPKRWRLSEHSTCRNARR